VLWLLKVSERLHGTWTQGVSKHEFLVGTDYGTFHGLHEVYTVTQPISRWLILTQYYPPEIGAPQIRLRSVAHMLRRHGIAGEVRAAMPNYPAGKIFPGSTE
jgi:hypothetical protein